MKILKYEDKNLELALKKCLEELNLTENDIIYEVEETEAKLFKSKKVILSVITKDSVKDFIKEFIKNISNLMNIDIKLEVKEEDNIYNVIMVSNNNPILIGKEGRTIAALQLLLRQSLTAKTGMNIKVNLDASNYKAKKVKNFEYEIKKIIREVQKSKIDAKLDPMNSYQRRIVHNLVNKYDNLSSESIGVEPERYIIIKYED